MMTNLYTGKGFGAIDDAPTGNGGFLMLKDGESAIVRIVCPMEEITSMFVHKIKDATGKWTSARCIGKNANNTDNGQCPLCNAGKRPSFRTVALVFDRADNKVKYWEMSNTVAKSLQVINQEYGDLTKLDLKITRSGNGTSTQYMLFARPAKDFEETVDPVTYEQVLNNNLEMQNVFPIKTVQELQALATGTTPPMNNQFGGANNEDIPF